MLEGLTVFESDPKISPDFISVSEKLIAEGTKQHDEIHGLNGLVPKPYHETVHIVVVSTYAEKLSKFFGTSKRSWYVVRIAVAWHDEKILFELPNPNELLGQIVRLRGARAGDLPSGSDGSEARSARLIAGEMRKTPQIFTSEDISSVVLAIDMTYVRVELKKLSEYEYWDAATRANPKLIETIDKIPGGGQNSELYITQPHFDELLNSEEAVPLPALIMALADLGTCGMGTAQEFFAEGDAECRELYENLRKANFEAILPHATEVISTLLYWLDGQPGFVAWQALRFEKLVYRLTAKGQLDDEKASGLRKIFCHFEENILATADRAKSIRAEVNKLVEEENETEALHYLLLKMGFEV